jgi:hypothetical protein
MRICLVCMHFVPAVESQCNKCGSDEKSWRHVFLSICAGDSAFRITDLPFEAARHWLKDQFAILADSDGNPCYKYMSKSCPMFLIEADVKGVVFRSNIMPDQNHFRIDGEPISAKGIAFAVSKANSRKLELWSQKRKGIVLTLTVRFECHQDW